MSMLNLKDDREEVEDDLYYGQIVIITFRWILIIGALVLTLWAPGGIGPNTVLIVALLLGYAVVNFFLHAQYLRGAPSLPSVVYMVSLADLALITFVIAFLQEGFRSSVYVFYLPALLAITVAFPRYVAAPMAIGVITLYGLIAFGSSTAADVQVVIIRLLMMAAVAFTGGLYRQIEQDRRSGKGKMVVLFGGAPARPRRPGRPTRRPARAASTDGTTTAADDAVPAR